MRKIMKRYVILYVKELKTLIIPSRLLALSYGIFIVFFLRLGHYSLKDLSRYDVFPILMMYSILILAPIMLV